MGDINWGVRNDYSNKDIDSLRGHENDSTSNVMNDVRKASVANTGASVTIRGDDKSAKEMRDEDRAEFVKDLTIVPQIKDKVVDQAIELAGDYVELNAGFAKAGYDTVKSNVRVMLMGDQLGKAVQGDNMHRALLSQLNLPAGFKSEAMDPFVERETEGSASGAASMAGKLHTDPEWHAKAAILQLHCDQGMNAARSMIADGAWSQGTFMLRHPDIAKKYVEDPAFKAGFDCVSWAHKEGKETYDALSKEIDTRDARYEAHHVAWRG